MKHSCQVQAFSGRLSPLPKSRAQSRDLDRVAAAICGKFLSVEALRRAGLAQPFIDWNHPRVKWEAGGWPIQARLWLEWDVGNSRIRKLARPFVHVVVTEQSPTWRERMKVSRKERRELSRVIQQGFAQAWMNDAAQKKMAKLDAKETKLQKGFGFLGTRSLQGIKRWWLRARGVVPTSVP